MPVEPRPIRLWILSDQKPGHTSQLHGLADRLTALADIDIRWVDALTLHAHWQEWLLKRWPESDGQHLPDGGQDSPAGWQHSPEGGQHSPDIVIGAGSASHTLILLAKRVFGCMTAVIMRPSIPLYFYDAAIVPRHDRPPARDNILVTRGVMNTVQPRAANAQVSEHTILVGGVSKHFEWSSSQVIAQIKQVLVAHPEQRWTLTNSRRTPEDFQALLMAESLPNLRFLSHTETPRGWLAEQLKQSAEVWVTPDSVSMVYEAITSGAATGLFRLEPLRHGRIHEGLDEIVAHALCTPFERWQHTHTLPPPAERLWEADRGARWLLERYRVWRTGQRVLRL